MEITLYEYDDYIRKKGFTLIAGVDEAGRGPLAGPIVAASVILPDKLILKGVNDSKKLSEKLRQNLFWEILLNAKSIGLGIAEVSDIDRMNIRQATILAMHRAVCNLTCKPDIVLIDALYVPTLGIKQMAIIKGDSKSASIAAASIIAKVVRDGIMMKYHSYYPQYEFDKHKGYGTKLHLKKIEKYGPCAIHRLSFKKVKDLMLPFP